MRKKILLVILLQIFVYLGYSQDIIQQTVDSNLKIQDVPQAVVEPGDPGDGGDGDPPLGYQWNRDADGDGYGDPKDYVFSANKPRGYVANQQDCDDTDPNIKASDQIWYRDVDKDGYGVKTLTTKGCFQPVGFSSNDTDLDDTNPNITNIPPKYFYRDADGDTFGNASVSVYYSVKPVGYVTNTADCNDSDAGINPNTIWYRDVDGDSFGATAPTLVQCAQPVGYVRNSSDYNDTTANITNIPPQYFYKDTDGDTFGNASLSLYYSVKPTGYVANSTDCNDNDATLNPNTIWFRDADGDTFGTSATRLVQCSQPVGYVRNAADYNDATVNITNIAPQYFYRDADGDTFGNVAVSVYYSLKPTGYVANSADCNDNDSSLNPNTIWYRDSDGDSFGATTPVSVQCAQPSGYVRNASDYNDTTANITNIAPSTFYRDADGDTFGNPSLSVSYSVKPAGYVTNNSDCNDTDSAINLNTIWYRDADGDSFGTSAIKLIQCLQPAGYVRNSTDYNDATVNITNIAPATFYRDADGDTFGNASVSVYYSVKPTGYVTNNTDCNDSDATINPNTIWYRDADGDTFGIGATKLVQCTQPTGYVRNSSDYDDTTMNITNIAPTTFYKDADGDTFGNASISLYYSVKPTGYVNNNTDCNDSDATINPNTIWYRDADGDTFGTAATKLVQCTQPTGYVRNSSDYNDTTVNITNIAPQYFYQDLDGDGYGNSSVSVYYSVKPAGYSIYGGDLIDTDFYITNVPAHDVYRDADGDGFGYRWNTSAASVSRPGYVENSTDCNDNDAAINPNTIWYLDDDLDGLGDPAHFLKQCAIPNGHYVLNNSDNCPLITGTYSDCSAITTPSSDQNYVITKIYKQALTSAVDFPTGDQVQSSITYFDGLGRPMQKIASRQSSSSKDLITAMGYDDFGRETKEYLPYESSSDNMAYDKDAETTGAINFYTTEYYENTSNPFSDKKFENSPLNRVLKQAAPGTAWTMDSGQEIKFSYQTNSKDEVKLYKATTSWDASAGLYGITFSDGGTYQAGELIKTITYDENTAPKANVGTEEFKNKEGQVVLKRTYDAGVAHDTYYVYDIYGNLTYVIPPKVEGDIDFTVLSSLCYQYKYDDKNRLVEKKLPGKQWEFIVYDKLDRPVATGPAYSPFKDEKTVGWIITKYDVFGRPVYTGWSSGTATSASRSTMQASQNIATAINESRQSSGTIDAIDAHYSNIVAPASFKLLTVNYYDSYEFPNAQTLSSAIEGQTVLTNVKGIASGSWTRAITSASSTAGETSTIFYDKKARPIRNYLQNHMGGYTSNDSKFDFTGKTLYTITKHKRTSGSTEITVKEEFTYSPQERLLTHKHQINGGAVQLLASNTYDALGQLTNKKVGNSIGNPLQKVDYHYNIRGWLKEINKIANLQQDTDPADLFAFKINYETSQTDISDVKPLYNGNISETLWKTASDLHERAYGYKYDKLNRLTNAIYEKNGVTTSAFDENLSYDKNGNIKTLSRKGDYDPQLGNLDIDNLVYTYPANSNQLSKVADNSNNSSGFNDVNKIGDDYGYDDNGNMTSDKNKNITEISYNHLNLPKKITFGTMGTIEYFYSASGQKIGKTVTEGTVATVTDYLGGYQYKNNVLEFFPTAEGYVKNVSGGLSYVFQYKDHLGNVRVSYTKNPTTQVLEIIEENNYYPFGLKHKGYNDYLPTANKYKYNGKELQDELGLNMYDYGARNYDPALGRWMNIDPLAEQSRRFSPYTYALNNPVFFIDPDGMLSQAFINDLIKKSDNNSETKWVNKGNGDFSASNGESAKAEDEPSSENGEPPVNFFSRDGSSFMRVFDEKNKEGNYENGDGIFDVFGHGGIDVDGEGFFADMKFTGPFFDTAKDFDARMSKVSPAYKKQLESGFGAFTINLYICQSGSGNKSMAKKISKAHPAATVVAFDGFVMYGKDASGKAVINGASSNIKYNDNKGYRVVYQNGKEISRMLYSDYKASGKLF